MTSYQQRIFPGVLRPIIILVLLNLVAMILYDILEILAPEHVYILLKHTVRYALISALWVYFSMRALWYASERMQRKAVLETSNLSESKQAETSLEEIRERIRSRKRKESPAWE